MLGRIIIIKKVSGHPELTGKVSAISRVEGTKMYGTWGACPIDLKWDRWDFLCPFKN